MSRIFTALLEPIAIRCRSIGRLIAKVDEQGLYLYCRQHKTQHLLTWNDIEMIRKDIQEKTTKHVIYVDE